MAVGTERRIARLLLAAVLVITCVLIPLRLWNITYDVPPTAPLLGFPKRFTVYSWDAAVYADEGLYAHDAIKFAQDGSFYEAYDYNQFINLPLMQFIKGAIFSIFGISLLAARMVPFLCAVGMMASMYFLVRRYEDHSVALLATFFLAINHYIFAFSRYAIDEVPVAFWVTLTFALAVRVRGERWWLFAILTAAAFACALLTKTNAIFATPLIGAIVIIQELDWKRIALKFTVCSAVFLGIMGLWYVTLAMTHMEEFQYFFTLNVGLTSSTDPMHLWDLYRHQLGLLFMVDWWITWAMLVATPLLLVLSRNYRLHPLVYLSVVWTLLYMAMYAYYGRFYPRFFAVVVPPMALWAALTVRYMLDLRGPFRLIAYLFVALAIWSSIWQLHRVASQLAYGRNSWNEAAAEMLRIIESDPSGNRIVMGHCAGSLALRTGVTPRHDRYGRLRPLEDRLAYHQPGWVISEGEMRLMPLDHYTTHTEWYYLLYEVELMGAFEVLENFRGYKMHLYKLTPREHVELPPPFAYAPAGYGFVTEVATP